MGLAAEAATDVGSVIGLYRLDKMSETVGQPYPRNRNRLILAMSVLATLVAVFTHLYRLGDLWPVPYFDPAYNGLDALRVIRRGITPIFFPANGGREPLVIYLQALSMGILGVNSFALRLPGALAGVLAVPALFGLARSLWGEEESLLADWPGVWAALGLALSAWHVSQARLGLRTALLPVASIATMWLFVDGWRRASLPRLAAAGALLGLTAYTYTAARFLPFVLALAVLPDLLARRRASDVSRRQRWLGFGLLSLTALVVFAPLGWYYLDHRAMFAERAASVMLWNVWQPGSGTTLVGEIALNVWRTVSWFSGFPVPIFAAMVVGLGVALVHLRRLEYRLLAAWWTVMLLPTIFTIETPHLMRSLGAAPPTYLLLGLGLATLASWISQRWTIPRAAIGVAALVVIFVSGVPPVWGYFHPAEKDSLTGIGAMVETLTVQAQEGAVNLPLSAYANPSLRFMLAQSFQRRADWSVSDEIARSHLVQRDRDSDSRVMVRLSPDGWITLLPPVGADWLTARQHGLGQGEPIIDHDGTVMAHSFALPASADPSQYLVQPDFDASAGVSGVAELAGYSLDTPGQDGDLLHLMPGGPLWVTTFWTAMGEASEDYDLTVYLIDDTGRRWGAASGPPLAGTYPTSMWRPGERVADDRLLWVYPEATPGRYWLAVAFYDYTTGSRLPVAGGTTPDTIQLGPLKVPAPPLTEPPDDAEPQPARFGNVARLLGYQLTQQPDGLTLDLYWQADTPDRQDYTIFVHVLDAQESVVLGHDTQPADGSYPTGIWERGEVVVDRHVLDTGSLLAGEYRIEIGMYSLETGERLHVALPEGTQEPGRRLVLSHRIEIQ